LERVLKYEEAHEAQAMKEALDWRDYQAVQRDKKICIAKAKKRADVCSVP
jgi:hypothetical protein